MNILKNYSLLTLFLPFIIFFSFFSTNELEAKKIKFTEICHWRAHKETFVKVKIPTFLEWLHFRIFAHDKEVPDSGECNESYVQVFALAYIDADQDGAYNAEIDVLIAKFEDTNEDGTFSAGDVITQGNYPMNFDPCPGGACIDVGSFNLQEYVLTSEDISNIDSDAGTILTLTTSNSGLYHGWININTYESYTLIGPEYNYVFFEDFQDPGYPSTDALVNSDPGNLLTDTYFTDVENLDQLDNYFINIELNNPDFEIETPPGDTL